MSCLRLFLFFSRLAVPTFSIDIFESFLTNFRTPDFTPFDANLGFMFLLAIESHDGDPKAVSFHPSAPHYSSPASFSRHLLCWVSCYLLSIHFESYDIPCEKRFLDDDLHHHPVFSLTQQGQRLPFFGIPGRPDYIINKTFSPLFGVPFCQLPRSYACQLP
jgi:hypothetical protein